MIASTPVPADPQGTLNQYFADKKARAAGDCTAGVINGQKMRLVVVGNQLDYRALSLLEKIKAFFGFGPAAFKKVVKFCGENGIEHRRLAITVLQYNRDHIFGSKKVESLFLKTYPGSLPADDELDARDVEGRTALHQAAGALDQHVKLTELILRGADIDIRDNSGVTAFMEACIEGDTVAAECLRLAGANVQARDKDGNTALHYHASEDDVSEKMINYLLDHDAAINSKNKMGRTALHEACQGPSYEVCKLLVERGAKVEEKDSDGMTPLMIACIHNRDETVKMLIEHGAKIENREALIALAKSSGAILVVKLLQS